MDRGPQRRDRTEGRRAGLLAAAVGIAAVAGGGTVAAVLPAVSTVGSRPPVVADTTVPGAPPFRRSPSSPITAIFP